MFLLESDSKGNTAWHMATFRGNLDLFQKIMDWAKENLAIQEMKICFY
jgi:endo-1,4-beta-D-glucanase Y